jgi:hypothetical protein
MKIITKFTLLAMLTAIPLIGFAQNRDKDKKQRIIDANPSLYYPFENVATAANPLVGDAYLSFYTWDGVNNSPGTLGGDPLPALHVPYEGKGAVLIPRGLHPQVQNPDPLPSDGGERLNTWSLLFDLNYPPMEKPYLALFQANGYDNGDVDICIRNSDKKVGIGNTGYSGPQVLPDTWYRLIVTLSYNETGVAVYKIYANGVEILSSNYPPIDGRFSVGEDFWLFLDDVGDENDLNLAGFAFWANHALTPEEVQALGGLNYEGLPFAEKPVLTPGKLSIIQAENFDKGGDDVAYQVKTSATNAYREEAVKIETGPDDDNYHLVTENGDWFNYSVSVPESTEGYEYIFWLYGQKTTGNYFSVLVNGEPVADATDVEFPATYDEPIELPVPLTLKQGDNLITIRSSGGNIDKFELAFYTPLPPLDPDKKQRIVDAAPSLYYPFEDVATAAEPLIGDLPLTFYTGDGTKYDPGVEGGEPLPALKVPYSGKGAVLIKRGLHVLVENPDPTPSDGGERLNTWSLLFDLNYPPMEKAYLALFQADEGHTTDCDICIRNSDKRVGIGDTGYSTKDVLPDTWYRLVITLCYNETGAAVYKIYSNGAEILSSSNPPVDGRFSIGDRFWLFLDDVGDENDFNLAGFAFWANRALTADEVHALGGAGYEGSPFDVHAVPGFVQAEDYDIGGEGEAFHVSNPTDKNTYRPGDATGIAAGPEGDYHLITANGDWYNYTISVPESKGYDYIFRVYGQKASGNYLNVLVNGVADENTTDVEFPTSYGEPVELAAPIKLKPGNNLITIQSTGGNLDKFEFEKAPFIYEGTPFFETPYIVPANGELVIEAEFFDRGGREIAFHDNSAGGGNDVSKLVRGEEDGSANVEMEYRNPQGGDNPTIGWSNLGEWIAYSLEVEEDGIYDVFLVLSTNNDDRPQHIEIDELAYPEIIAHTANWETWMDFSITNVELTAGKHTLYVYYHGNFDKIKIRKHLDVKPYENTPQTIPGIIEAWKFDEGGNGLTYFVKNETLGGENNAIRKDVQVPIGGNEADGYFVNVAESGTPSWLLYTVDVQTAGYYKVTFKVGCNIGGEKFTLSGKLGNASIVLPAAPDEWREVSFPILKLNEGLDTLKLESSGSEIKIASITVETLLDVIDRSHWNITVSSETASDGGGKNAMIDDKFDTYWHSQWTPSNVDLPHTAIFDLGYPVEISQIVTIRRNNGDTKTLQYSVSNDPNSETWSIIAEGAYAAQSDGIHDLTLDATQTVKARYLKLLLEESFRAPFTGIAEVYAIGKTFESIRTIEALPGKVYAENGILKVKEFPTTASLAVYNLLGQKLTDYKTLNGDVEISLPTKGIYIVKVQDKGLTSTYKVIVK